MTGLLFPKHESLTPKEALVYGLIHSARLTVFNAIKKFYERCPPDAQSLLLPPDDRYIERNSGSGIGFTGQTPKLLELLRFVVHAKTQVDIYNSDETENALQSKWSRLTANPFTAGSDDAFLYSGPRNAVAKKYYDLWAGPESAEGATLLVEEITRRGLAFLMEHIIISYGEEKEGLKTKMVAHNVTDLANDYDYLREAGINPSVEGPSLMKGLSHDLIEEAMGTHEYLQALAPGLLILLRPDFLRVTLTYPYHRLSRHNPLMHPRSMDVDASLRFKNLLNESQADDNTLRVARVDLFEMLCGEHNGPWRLDFPENAPKLRTLHANAFMMCKSESTCSAQRQRREA